MRTLDPTNFTGLEKEVLQRFQTENSAGQIENFELGYLPGRPDVKVYVVLQIPEQDTGKVSVRHCVKYWFDVLFFPALSVAAEHQRTPMGYIREVLSVKDIIDNFDSEPTPGSRGPRQYHRLPTMLHVPPSLLQMVQDGPNWQFFGSAKFVITASMPFDVHTEKRWEELLEVMRAQLTQEKLEASNLEVKMCPFIG